MKKHATLPLLYLTLILMLASVGYSQTSDDSTPPDRATTISLCEKAKDEVVTSRVLVSQYEEMLAAQEKEQTLSDAQIASLRESLDAEKRALAKKQLEVDTYKKALSKEIKKKNFYKKMFKVTGVILIGVSAAAVAK